MVRPPNEQDRRRLGKPVLAGFCGAIAPNLLQATSQALSGSGDPLMTQATFWVGAIVAASFGALLVYFYDERSPQKAIALGAAAPALILGFAGGLPQRADDSGPQDNGPAAQVSDTSASAVPVVLIPAAGRPTIGATQPSVVMVRGTGFEHARQLDLVAVQVRGGAQQPNRITGVGIPVPLPSGTTEIFIRADGAESNRVSLAGVSADTVVVTVTVQAPGVRGFARAFGIRNAGSLRVSLELAATGAGNAGVRSS